MNIVCAICSDLLVPSKNVSTIWCGHIFHSQCLKRWLKRSKTCPQCHKRTTYGMIRRIYLNFSNSNSIVENSSLVQDKIHVMDFLISMINFLKEIKQELSNDSMISLQNQIECYKQQCLDYKKENEELNKKVEDLKKELANFSTSERKVIDIWKRKLIDILKNLKQKLMQTYNKFLTEKHTKQKKLEKQLIVCERIVQLMHLQAQLLEMKISAHKCFGDKVIAVKQSDSKMRNVPNLEKFMIENKSVKLEDIVKLEKNDSCVSIDNATNTPQNIKSEDSFLVKNQYIKRTLSNLEVSSVLTKKCKFSQLS